LRSDPLVTACKNTFLANSNNKKTNNWSNKNYTQFDRIQIRSKFQK
jgi:hypothetical protein